MGRIKTTFIKRIAKELYEKHEDKFTDNYDKNKQALEPLIRFESKRMRNIVAGYLTKMKKQNN